jgi:hypothetical protein
LLSKQLMYFERYGRLFLADVPLLSDPAFFKELLKTAPNIEQPGLKPPGRARSGLRAPRR